MNDAPDTYHGVKSLAVYNICTELSSTEILEEVSKYIKGNVINVQFEEQRNKDDELVSDIKQSARRVYAFIGKINMDINQEVLMGLRKIMIYNSIYEDQVHLLTTLPFWTTSRYYYLKKSTIETPVENVYPPKNNIRGEKK